MAYSFLALYTLLSIGLEVNLHYCSDQLKAIALWENASCCHSEHDDQDSEHQHLDCSMTDSNCCTDASFDLSIDDYHTGGQLILLEHASPQLASLSIANMASFATTFVLEEKANRGPPPLVHATDPYILFQQFITYG